MMRFSKRDFLRSVAGIGALSAFRPAFASPTSFWEDIRAAYGVTDSFIQLENGYYSLASNEVLEPYLRHIQDINKVSSYYMRTRQADDKLASRTAVAELLGCGLEELIITRNTTESLDTIISGIDWKAGDEAIMAGQDYGAMLDMFRLMSRRHGIVNKVLSIPNQGISDDELVRLYESAITPKTRLLMVCHLINITGRIMPVRQITEMAHRHGVEVLVDGAHAFAHLDFRIADLGGCDYYGSSLHKWLGTPLGAGLLYVRKDKIRGIWPLFGDSSFADDDIRKLNHTGTHPVATDLAIQNAIAFHRKIGSKRKEERLRYLQQYWTDAVRDLPKIVLNTPKDRSCAIANVGIQGMAPADLAKTLFQKYRIFTVAIAGAGVMGVRVTPHVYTTTAELDQFVAALRVLAS